MKYVSVILFAMGSLLALAAGSASADDIRRNKTVGSDFPIAQSVQVPGASELIFVSGAVPKPIIENGDPDDPATFGDTEVQTISVLKEIQRRLQRLGLDLEDVVMMRAYLVGTPDTDGRMDFSGFMRGYTQFFGTQEQPNLPSRSAIQIAGLVRGGWFVEIEVVAARLP